MLLSGRRKETIEIETPAGVKYAPALEDIRIGEDYVRCAVRKDAGDDPDSDAARAQSECRQCGDQFRTEADDREGAPRGHGSL